MGMSAKGVEHHLDNIQHSMGMGKFHTAAVSIKFSRDIIVQEFESRERELNELKAFKDAMMEMHGLGLQINNWHLNGAPEPLDTFIDRALNSST